MIQFGKTGKLSWTVVFPKESEDGCHQVFTSSQSALLQPSSVQGQRCCKGTVPLSLYYLDDLDVESSLSLPLIGKPAVVQTECLDHNPLLVLSALLSCVATSRIF